MSTPARIAGRRRVYLDTVLGERHVDAEAVEPVRRQGDGAQLEPDVVTDRQQLTDVTDHLARVQQEGTEARPHRHRTATHTVLQHAALQHAALQHTALQHAALQHTALQHTALQHTALQHTVGHTRSSQYTKTKYMEFQYDKAQYSLHVRVMLYWTLVSHTDDVLKKVNE